MTERKPTCVACKETVTLGTEQIITADKEFSGDIAFSGKITASGDVVVSGEVKATGQPEYTADADTDLVATIGTLDGYTPMVRTTGNQPIYGGKVFKDGLFTDGAVFGSVNCLVTDRPSDAVYSYPIGFIDSEGNRSASIYCKKVGDYTQIIASVTGPSGTVHDEVLSQINDPASP